MMHDQIGVRVVVCLGLCSQRVCPTSFHTQLLSKHQILSAPVLDDEGEYVGAVSVPDILRGLIRSEYPSSVCSAALHIPPYPLHIPPRIPCCLPLCQHFRIVHHWM
jgi:hypothetical protein